MTKITAKEVNEREKAKQWVYGIVEAIVPYMILGYALIYFLTPVDDCDKSRWERCNMKILTDYKTGKQYLTTANGGIIERGAK